MTRKRFSYERLGFPIVLVGFKMKKVRGEVLPDVNFKELQAMVFVCEFIEDHLRLKVKSKAAMSVMIVSKSGVLSKNMEDIASKSLFRSAFLVSGGARRNVPCRASSYLAEAARKKTAL